MLQAAARFRDKVPTAKNHVAMVREISPSRRSRARSKCSSLYQQWWWLMKSNKSFQWRMRAGTAQVVIAKREKPRNMSR